MEEEFDFSDIVGTPKEFDFSDVVETPSNVDPRVAQAFAVSRAGKTFKQTVEQANATAKKSFSDWAESRAQEISKNIKTDADVPKYTELFKQEQAAKIAEIQQKFKDEVNPSFKAWKELSEQAPLRDPSAPTTPVTDFLRSGASFFTNTLPQTVATLQLREAPQKFDDLFRQGYENRALPDESVKPLLLEFKQWKNEKGIPNQVAFDPEAHTKEVQQFFDEVKGPGSYSRFKSQYEPGLIKNRLAYEADIASQKKQAAEDLVGTVGDVGDVQSVSDFAALVGNLAGQTIPQLAVTALTGGGATLVQEMATVYDGQIDAIAAEKGITREEVLSQGLDKPAEGAVYAAAAGALDYLAITKLLKGLKSGAVQKAIGVATEAVTEPIQGALEEKGANPAQKTFMEGFTGDALRRRATEALGGLIGSSVITSFSPSQASDIVAAEIDPAIVDLQNKVFEDAKGVHKDEGQVQEVNAPQASQDQSGQDLQQPAKQEEVNAEAPPQVEPDVYGGDVAEGGPGIGLDFDKATKRLLIEDETVYTDKGRQLIERALQSGQINDAQSRDLLAKLNNSSGKNRSVKSVRTFTDSFRKAMGLPVEVKTTDVKQFVDGLKNFINGFRTGVKDVRMTMAELKAKVTELRELTNLPQAKERSILTRVLSLNPGSNVQVNRLNNYIQKLVDGLPVDEKYSKAAELAASVKRNIKKIPASQREAIKSLVSINPNKVDDIDSYLSVVENASKYLANPTKDYEALNNANNIPKIGAIKEAVRQDKLAELAELGITDVADHSDVELDQILDGTTEEIDAFSQNAADAKRIEVRDKIMDTLDFAKLGLPDDDYGRLLSSIDASEMKNSDVLKLVKAIDNYTQNGVEEGWATEVAKVQQAVKKAEGLNAHVLTKKITATGGTLFAKLQYAMGFAREQAAKLMHLSGMDEAKNKMAEANKMSKELAKKLEDKITSLFGTLTPEQSRKLVIIESVLGKAGAWYTDYKYSEEQQFARALNAIGLSYENAKVAKDLDEEMVGRQKEAVNFVNGLNTTSKANFFADVQAKFPKEYALWKWMQEQMSPVSPQLKYITEVYHNTPYKEMMGYAGHSSVRTLTGTPIPELEAPMFSKDPKKPIKVTMSETAYNRSSELAPNQIYTHDSLNDFIKGYKESMSDVLATPARLRSRLFFSDPRVATIFGDNLNTIKEAYFGMDDALASGRLSQGEANWERKARTNAVWRTGNLLSRMYKTTLLSGPSRFLQQTVPIYAQLLFTVDPGLIAKAHRLVSEAGDDPKLFDKVPLGLRAGMSGGFSIGDAEYNFSKTGLSLGVDKIDYIQNMVDRFNESTKTKWGQTKGDVDSARVTWVAMYLDWLQKHGISTDIDLNEEYSKADERAEAIAYANGATDIIAGPSQMEELPEIFRDKRFTTQLVKNLFFFLGTFPALQKANMGDAVMAMRYGPARKEAAKQAAGIIASTTTYAAISTALGLAYTEAAKQLLSALDIDGEEEEKEEQSTIGDIFVKAGIDATPFTMVLGSASEQAFKYGVNQLQYAASGSEKTYDQWTRDGGGLPSAPVPKDGLGELLNLATPYLGMVTGIAGPIKEFYAIDKDSNTYMINGEEYSLSDKQEQTLLLLTMFDAFSAFGFDQTELRQIRRNMKKQIRTGLQSSGSGAPSELSVPQFTNE